jgi:hypothetical protein
VIRTVGTIAAPGDRNGRRLIHDVIEASSAIPPAFPPVPIPVEGPGGPRHDETHADWGAARRGMPLSARLRGPPIHAAAGAGPIADPSCGNSRGSAWAG